ncbi:hypothetical protein [Halorarius litoreus]|uniref:hypothetical protein n=1 Tax=Halorarius litoreus TaxID=2962676 RepID=UPI0020CDD418|nr:hypothetical protein [Halorarius litoreus]
MWPGRTSPRWVAASVVVSLLFLGAWSLLTGAPVVGPAHDLGGVAVDNAGFEAHEVAVQVFRDPVGGEPTRVTAETLTVPAGDYPTPTGDGGVATGMGRAGRARLASGWENPGDFDVRVRLVGRETWATIDLGAADRANDDAWWVDLLDRHDGFEEIECFGVRAVVDTTEPAGVAVSTTSCGVV